MDSYLINQSNREIETYIDSMDNRISKNLGISKSNLTKESPINRIFIENNVLWETYIINKDSIDHYANENEFQNLEIFLKKIKTLE